MVLGPGTVGETSSASDLLAASGPGGVDAFSYHHYGTLSERCSGTSAPEAALSEEWLSRTDQTLTFYRVASRQVRTWQADLANRNRGGSVRRKPVGRDLPGYVQISRSAWATGEGRRSGRDAQHARGKRLRPAGRENAGAQTQLLGRTVVATTNGNAPCSIRVCRFKRASMSMPTANAGPPGGVSLLIINTDRNAPHSLMLPTASERYTLDAANLRDATVRLNGSALGLSALDDLPRITAALTRAGTQTFAPATITFLAIPDAANTACRRRH